MNVTDVKFARRLLIVILGNVLLGFGTSILRLSGFGTDPFNCMNVGVSSQIGWTLGTYQMLLNIVLFIPIFLLDRKSFGIGALINMFAIGYIIDGFMALYGSMGITIEGMAGNMPLRIVQLVVGLLIVCAGVAIYMECDMGAAPYDRLAVVIETLSGGKIPFRWARVAYDIVAVTIGFLTGATIGIATAVLAFFTGPLVSFMKKNLARPLLGLPRNA